MRLEEQAAQRICFVAPKAAALVSGTVVAGRAGGAETQQVLVAEELARRGWDVHFVVAGPPAPPLPAYRMFTLHHLPIAHGVPGVRCLHPRWTGLARALRSANADIYYQRGNGAETGQVALWCRLRRRAFVFAAASDSNADPDLPDLRSVHERLLYRLGLRLAAGVVVQTEAQQHAFRKHMNCRTHIIRSIGRHAERQRQRAPTERVLWVGRINDKKRPEWVLDLARRMPGTSFDVAADITAAAERFRCAAAALPNVVLHGFVPPEQLDRLYDQAAVVLCTSRTEGFPNVFLEAWARGIPTVTTVDPDGLVARFGLGGVAETLDGLAAELHRLISSRPERCACGRRACHYFNQSHTPEGVGDTYAELLRTILTRRSAKCLPSSV